MLSPELIELREVAFALPEVAKALEDAHRKIAPKKLIAQLD